MLNHWNWKYFYEHTIRKHSVFPPGWNLSLGWNSPCNRALCARVPVMNPYFLLNCKQKNFVGNRYSIKRKRKAHTYYYFHANKNPLSWTCLLSFTLSLYLYNSCQYWFTDRFIRVFRLKFSNMLRIVLRLNHLRLKPTLLAKLRIMRLARNVVILIKNIQCMAKDYKQGP